jgi:hypothetical protein
MEVTTLIRYQKIEHCRVSGDKNLISVLHLGEQALTGVFPASKTDIVTTAPLELVWCPTSGLLQLNHSCDFNEMYGDNYGYRSGLNHSMIAHLRQKTLYLEQLTQLKAGDAVLDIGSNDGTLLKAYSNPNIQRIGIDPTGKKFASYYTKEIKLIPDYFSAANYHSATNQPAKIVTSIAMFYDLESPIHFAREVESILADDGIWHFEQSYMPSMIQLNAYDTICHEHLEYYSLSVIKKILDAAELKPVKISLNNINGGSFAITATKIHNHSIKPDLTLINWFLEEEERMGFSTIKPYHDFQHRVFEHRDKLKKLIHLLIADGKRILGYGASTKGNVLLQLCGLTTAEIPAIAEVNEDKFGRLTPGTHIPIISDKEARAMKPDYFLVLPWHFKEGILRKEQEYLTHGGKFIFPFPVIEII